MSINQIQTKNILELIAKSYFVSGINPQTLQLYSFMSEYFSQNPIGTPVTLDVNLFLNINKSDPELVNDFMAMMIVNLDTLYEACANHVEETMMLNTVLRTHLDRLKIKRNVLESRIDDYLLGIYNSDGYFYSFSDSFSNTAYVDFNFTSAFVDTAASLASLPAISTVSRKVDAASISDPIISITDEAGESLVWLKKTDFENAVDGMTNTAWYVEVRTTTPQTITMDLELTLATLLSSRKISKIDLIPFGVSPVQCGINATFLKDDGIRVSTPFSNYVKKSADKMSFIGDQIDFNVEKINLQLTKSENDYIEDGVSIRTYVYIFGFKEIIIAEQAYDSFATLVTQPFGMPEELADESTIDSVSLVVEDFVPTNTSLTYYVAADNADATSISDFDWQAITPIGTSNSNTFAVHFNGSTETKKMVRSRTRTGGDLKLIEKNTTSSDLAKRNPTPAFFPGLDVYRICALTDDFLAGTLRLEEGINTTRICYTNLSAAAVVEDFGYWKVVCDDPALFTMVYGEIDAGHEFFYGADVGEDAKSVYVETYLTTDREYPVFLKECRKSDTNSRVWDMRVFLNGKEIANMPAGVDKITVPWKLKEGLNHIGVMINIPEATEANPLPYIGTFNIMTDDLLTNYGTVKLDNWTYVDTYKFQNNQTNDASTFTIYNKEIVSRKEPTNNFRLTYKTPTTASPEALRLRADFTRANSSSTSTPIFDLYRVRFSYK